MAGSGDSPNCGTPSASLGPRGSQDWRTGGRWSWARSPLPSAGWRLAGRSPQNSEVSISPSAPAAQRRRRSPKPQVETWALLPREGHSHPQALCSPRGWGAHRPLRVAPRCRTGAFSRIHVCVAFSGGCGVRSQGPDLGDLSQRQGLVPDAGTPPHGGVQESEPGSAACPQGAGRLLCLGGDLRPEVLLSAVGITACLKLVFHACCQPLEHRSAGPVFQGKPPPGLVLGDQQTLIPSVLYTQVRGERSYLFLGMASLQVGALVSRMETAGGGDRNFSIFVKHSVERLVRATRSVNMLVTVGG